MNRVWSLVLVVGLLAGSAAYGGNLLKNASFEDAEMDADNPYGDLAAGWGRWGHWVNRETGWKPTRSGKCLIGYHHWEITTDETSGVYQDVDEVEAETTCVFSVFAAKDKDTNAQSIELRLEKVGGYETLASTVYPLSELKGTGWTKLTVTGRAGADDGVRVVIVITPAAETPRSGAIKLDDAELTTE